MLLVLKISDLYSKPSSEHTRSYSVTLVARYPSVSEEYNQRQKKPYNPPAAYSIKPELLETLHGPFNLSAQDCSKGYLGVIEIFEYLLLTLALAIDRENRYPHIGWQQTLGEKS
jgi:hypothetical protein